MITEMEVHIRKEHSEKFEFSLCGLRGESLDELKAHLLTCDVKCMIAINVKREQKL